LFKRVEDIEEHPRDEKIPLVSLHVQAIFGDEDVIGEKEKKTKDKQENTGHLVVVVSR